MGWFIALLIVVVLVIIYLAYDNTQLNDAKEMIKAKDDIKFDCSQCIYSTMDGARECDQCRGWEKK